MSIRMESPREDHFASKSRDWLIRELAESQKREAEWTITYADCPHCGWTHDTEGETQPIHCHGCHKPFNQVDVLLQLQQERDRLREVLKFIRNHTSVNSYQIECIDQATNVPSSSAKS